MVNKNLLDKLGFKVNPKVAGNTQTVSTREIIDNTLDQNNKSGSRNYGGIALGSMLFADGLRDVVAAALSKSVDEYAIFEVLVGGVTAYFSTKSQATKESHTHSIAKALTKHYVKD